VAGVAGGLSERLGVDPVVVRLAFVVLAFAAGAGVVLYFLLWLVASEPAGTPPTAAGPFPPPPRGSHVGDRRALGLGLMVAGSLLLLREMGLWFGDKLVWPVALAALGSAVIWTRGDSARWARLDRATRRMRLASAAVSKLRILAGGILVAGGMAAFLAAHQALTAAKNVAFAVAVTATGVALVLGPWIYRLARQLSDERRERIRSEERGEMAAHLHDSVLQTLAMIQRSGSPQEMSSLARSQERELRSWLYGRARTGAEILTDASVSDAVDAMAARVERLQRVAVETVVVGDRPLDERLRSLIDACGEGVMNAARHSGASEVSVYLEMDDGGATAFVRDQGKGFDPALVPSDRRGIADSICGRMERIGGTASIVSSPGLGTEIRLRLPAAPRAAR